MFCDLPLPLTHETGLARPVPAPPGVVFVEPQGPPLKIIWYSKSYIRQTCLLLINTLLVVLTKHEGRKKNPNKKKLQKRSIGIY